MKNYVLLFIVIFFSSGFAQKSNKAPTANKKTENAQPTPEKTSTEEVAVVAYAVEEKINMKFGGRTTTYAVSSLDLVDKNDLGPDNTRVIKPKYVKVKPKEELPVVDKLSSVPVVTTPTVIIPVKVDQTVPNGKLLYTKIKIIENYERVLEKGYKTEEMLVAVADYRFFEDDLVTAAKWYTQLFEYCPDELEAVYFYRYAKSLECVGQIEKAKQMMALYQIKKM
ncbi:hypothetical protein [Flavobacterium sangjuense]|uniref:Tetratricopeptide repeat protein n=1 Tax=Flavobacterium sangjuense TaxID=2518177 RepID=A0A4P7PVF0_9FLAO|nr:hypothetical protein [Flavobacterium sangjuense]QBZ98756.1 hypothetical protein GS03_02267 [Flavobacterium sangjuense]